MSRTSLYLISIGLLVLISIIAVLLILPQGEQSENNSINLANQFESNAFTFNYPEGWQYQIPQTNMLFLASPEILSQQAGATVTIQRSVTLSSQTDSLEDALNSYLLRGPLRADRAWEMVTEIEGAELDNYEALSVLVEGSEQEGTLIMRSEIYLLQADSSFFFILTLTAPLEQWDELAPTFQAIINSVDILE